MRQMLPLDQSSGCTSSQQTTLWDLQSHLLSVCYQGTWSRGSAGPTFVKAIKQLHIDSKPKIPKSALKTLVHCYPKNQEWFWTLGSSSFPITFVRETLSIGWESIQLSAGCFQAIQVQLLELQTGTAAGGRADTEVHVLAHKPGT
jgi:hypothetical protein